MSQFKKYLEIVQENKEVYTEASPWPFDVKKELTDVEDRINEIFKQRNNQDDNRKEQKMTSQEKIEHYNEISEEIIERIDKDNTQANIFYEYAKHVLKKKWDQMYLNHINGNIITKKIIDKIEGIIEKDQFYRKSYFEYLDDNMKIKPSEPQDYLIKVKEKVNEQEKNVLSLLKFLIMCSKKGIEYATKYYGPKYQEFDLEVAKISKEKKEEIIKFLKQKYNPNFISDFISRFLSDVLEKEDIENIEADIVKIEQIMKKPDDIISKFFRKK